MHAFWEIVASNSLVVVVLALGVAFLGRYWKNPVGLHFLWVFVLLKLVTPPVVTVGIPLAVSMAPFRAERQEASQVVIDPSSVEVSREARVAPFALNGQDQSSPEKRAASRYLDPPNAVITAAAVPHRMPWSSILAWTWGAGIVLLAFGHARRILRFRSLLRAAEAPPSALLCMAEEIGKRLRLRRLPEIALLSVRLSPFVWFMGSRPRVFLPAALLKRLDAESQQAILAHELAHIRRQDHWVRLLELVVATLFWWHPVVWWACNQLRELEEQCCDGLVLDTTPHGAKAYASALLDTLDFLSDRSITVPLLATAANSPVSLARRITMLKNHSPQAPLTTLRVALLAVVVAGPMAIAFEAQAPPAANRSRSGDQQSIEQPAVQRRAINKLVKDFPEKSDLSTPESAQAAWNRASARMDDQAVLELSWVKWGPRDIENMKRSRKSNPRETEIYNEAQMNAEILEVATNRGDCAFVISKLSFPEGVGRDPYSIRTFGRINGVWKNLGENRLPSLEAARADVDSRIYRVWWFYEQVRDRVEQGLDLSSRGEAESSAARIAPGEPQGITVEKADLMGRVEWVMLHDGKEAPARKPIEWGEIERDKKGNRTIRYKYSITIRNGDVYIMNEVFTFDAKGNIVNRQDLPGFPQKELEKPVNVSAQEGMKELIEDFFGKNYRDITSRETIEWGEVTKAANGNSSVRYKYRARIWDKDVKIMNQVFTFDPKGKFVSVKEVERFPQHE